MAAVVVVVVVANVGIFRVKQHYLSDASYELAEAIVEGTEKRQRDGGRPKKRVIAAR